jgi:hypothetical protein
MINLTTQERNQLISFLLPLLATEKERRQLLESVGLKDLSHHIDLSGSPFTACNVMVNYLLAYGCFGRAEALGILLKSVKDLKMVGQQQQDFFNLLLVKYSMMNPPAVQPPVINGGHVSPGATPGGSSRTVTTYMPVPLESPVKPKVPTDRSRQIQELYEAAQANGWSISPTKENVQEQINLRFNAANDRLVLVVSTSYPQQRPFVTEVYVGGTRLPTRQINAVVDPIIQSGTYDLKKIVQAIKEALL